MPRPESEPRTPDYRAYLAAYEQAWQRSQREPTPWNLAILHAGEDILIHELLKPGRFELGQIVGTPGALDVIAVAGHVPPEFLLRHKHGARGNLSQEDRAANEQP